MLYVYGLLLFVLVGGIDIVVLVVRGLLIGWNGNWRFILFEMLFVLIVYMVIVNSSSFERGRAIGYFGFFRYIVGCMLLSGLSGGIVSVVRLVLVVSKLPLYGIHIGLNKIHVEASLFGSVILAGVVLKAGSMLLYLVGNYNGIGTIIVMAIVIIFYLYDGKGIMAISSVVHMSLAVFSRIVWYVGFSHIIVSPLLFLGVYQVSKNDGSRGWWLALIVTGLNLRFPLLGAFFGECGMGCLLGLFAAGYFLCFLIAYKIGHGGEGGSCGVIVLLLIVII